METGAMFTLSLPLANQPGLNTFAGAGSGRSQPLWPVETSDGWYNFRTLYGSTRCDAIERLIRHVDTRGSIQSGSLFLGELIFGSVEVPFAPEPDFLTAACGWPKTLPLMGMRPDRLTVISHFWEGNRAHSRASTKTIVSAPAIGRARRGLIRHGKAGRRSADFGRDFILQDRVRSGDGVLVISNGGRCERQA
jgi:hypothetical protein